MNNYKGLLGDLDCCISESINDRAVEAIKNLIAERDAAQTKIVEQQARIEQLRKALQTLIDEHEECTDADDWMAMMCSCEAIHVCDDVLSVQDDLAALREHDEKLLADAQVKIDAFMLEYCQDEMSPEQLANWAVHQISALDLLTCPNCGGDADNGFSRGIPPSPYFCTKCDDAIEKGTDK